MQLYPHILLRTDAGASALATTLRCAGYVVTKVRSDDDAERLVSALHVDAMVVDLPALDAMALLRRVGLLGVPVLVATNVPESLRRIRGDIATLPAHKADDDVISAVDLLIARGVAAGFSRPAEAGRYTDFLYASR